MASVEMLIIVCVAVIAVGTNGDECRKGSERSILQPQVLADDAAGAITERRDPERLLRRRTACDQRGSERELLAV